MDAVPSHPNPSPTTASNPSVVIFDPPTLVAYAIRRAVSLTESDRLALADQLERLPHPDNAAGRLLARRIREFRL